MDAVLLVLGLFSPDNALIKAERKTRPQNEFNPIFERPTINLTRGVFLRSAIIKISLQSLRSCCLLLN